VSRTTRWSRQELVCPCWPRRALAAGERQSIDAALASTSSSPRCSPPSGGMKQLTMLLACLTSLASLGQASAGGNAAVDFSRAWRFHRGDDPAAVPAVFAHSLDGCVCQDPFLVTPVGRMNSTDCERYAGATGAFGWNWTPRKPGWWAEQCKVAWEKPASSTCDCSKGAAPDGVVGGLRPSVPPDPDTYGFAGPSHNDSSWPVVDAPHDAVLDGVTFDQSCDESHGYVCRPVSWYRKHARLPASWSGQAVRLVIGASLQRTEVFVQGKRVFVNELGYTPFETRIDHAISGWSESGSPPAATQHIKMQGMRHTLNGC